MKTINLNEIKFEVKVSDFYLLESVKNNQNVTNHIESNRLLDLNIYIGNYVIIKQPACFDFNSHSFKLASPIFKVEKGLNVVPLYSRLIHWEKISSSNREDNSINCKGVFLITENFAICNVKFCLNILTKDISELVLPQDIDNTNKVVPWAIDMKPKFPKKLNIELTQHCNLKCSYCTQPNLKEKGKLSINHVFSYADEDSYRKLVKVSFTGLGETLLSKDFWPAVEYFSNLNVYTTLITNGMLLHKFAERIVNSGLKAIAVTLDSMSEEHFQKKRKNSCLSKILSGIEALIYHAEKKHIDIGIICPFSPKEIEHAIDVIDYCFSNNLPPPKLYPIYEFEKLEIDKEYLLWAFEILRQRIQLKWNTKYKFLSREEALANKTVTNVTHCLEPNEVLVFRANGGFGLCNESIFDISKQNNSISLLEDWNSEYANKLRIKHALGITPDVCRNCNFTKLRKVN